MEKSSCACRYRHIFNKIKKLHLFVKCMLKSAYEIPSFVSYVGLVQESDTQTEVPLSCDTVSARSMYETAGLVHFTGFQDKCLQHEISLGRDLWIRL